MRTNWKKSVIAILLAFLLPATLVFASDDSTESSVDTAEAAQPVEQPAAEPAPEPDPEPAPEPAGEPDVPETPAESPAEPEEPVQSAEDPSEPAAEPEPSASDPEPEPGEAADPVGEGPAGADVSDELPADDTVPGAAADPDDASADPSSAEIPADNAEDVFTNLDLYGDGPERDLDPSELWEYEEATFNFNFIVDTTWDSYKDIMFIAVRNAATMISAVNTINSLGDGVYIIALAADITVPLSAEGLVFSCGDTTILGCGHTLTLQPEDGADLCLAVSGEDTRLSLGSTMIDDTLTITGSSPADNEDYPGMITVAGGTLDICSGVTLCGHTAGHGMGGAVSVTDGGTVRMFGGTITDCRIIGSGSLYGGGVGIASGSSFYMFGGEISNCRCVSFDDVSMGGGIAVTASGSVPADEALIQLQGGTISDCAASYGGGIAYVDYPGAVIMGDVSVCGNFAFADAPAAGGGIWCSADESFVLYLYGKCNVSQNDSYTLNVSAAEKLDLSARRGSLADVVISGSSPAWSTLHVEASDLCGADDHVRVGILKGSACVSVEDGSEVVYSLGLKEAGSEDASSDIVKPAADPASSARLLSPEAR